jgi:hypothetical protein
MTYSLDIRPQARADVLEYVEFIEQDSIDAADRFITNAYITFERLAGGQVQGIRERARIRRWRESEPFQWMAFRTIWCFTG